MNLPNVKTNVKTGTSLSAINVLFKKVRTERGLTLEYVAEHAAIEPLSRLYLFEQGQAELPLDRIYALANVLEVSPSLILSLTSSL